MDLQLVTKYFSTYKLYEKTLRYFLSAYKKNGFVIISLRKLNNTLCIMTFTCWRLK